MTDSRIGSRSKRVSIEPFIVPESKEKKVKNPTMMGLCQRSAGAPNGQS